MKNALMDLLKSRRIWYAVFSCLLFCLGIHFYTQWDLARFEAQRNDGPPARATQTHLPETQAGHFHPDGTFHEEPHEETRVPEGVKWTAPPGAATTPDFPPVAPNEDPVVAAYKRLDYIKNNIYAWGGVHSPRATELIAQLMPPPVLIDHNHGDEIEQLMEELIETRDPRGANVLITTMCEGSMGGARMTEALVAIGPPAVPHILPYLDVLDTPISRYGALKALSLIAAQYREDLGGIADYIIIPKLEAVLASEDVDYATKKYTREALSRLGR